MRWSSAAGLSEEGVFVVIPVTPDKAGPNKCCVLTKKLSVVRKLMEAAAEKGALFTD